MHSVYMTCSPCVYAPLPARLHTECTLPSQCGWGPGERRGLQLQSLGWRLLGAGAVKSPVGDGKGPCTSELQNLSRKGEPRGWWIGLLRTTGVVQGPCLHLRGSEGCRAPVWGAVPYSTGLLGQYDSRSPRAVSRELEGLGKRGPLAGPALNTCLPSRQGCSTWNTLEGWSMAEAIASHSQQYTKTTQLPAKKNPFSGERPPGYCQHASPMSPAPVL